VPLVGPVVLSGGDRSGGLAQEEDGHRPAGQFRSILAESPPHLEPERLCVEGEGALQIGHVDVDQHAHEPSGARGLKPHRQRL
jgi:hypothetical protein